MPFDMRTLCFATKQHVRHNVDVTLTHICSGANECGKGDVLDHKNHSITKMLLVECDGRPR